MGERVSENSQPSLTRKAAADPLLGDTQRFAAGGKSATLRFAENPNSPLVVLSGFDDDGADVAHALAQVGAADANLLFVGGLNWDRDLTPWAAPSAFKGYDPYAGGADSYLAQLLGEIIPQAKTRLNGAPSFTCIAGYSLAGLFALYTLHRCDEFSRAASVSGSFWFPSFVDFARTHAMPHRPDKLYLSLGSKEAKTNNPVLRTVQASADELVEHYRAQGLDVEFELNPGNHCKDRALRMAKGIKSILA